MKDEIEYYSNKDNPDWSKEKNNGFRKGIKYFYDLVMNMEKTEQYIPTQMISTSCVGVEISNSHGIRYINSDPPQGSKPPKPTRQY
ncbi:hypothetical protein AB8U03_15615 [Clostridium sp. Mt-5]|uniref:Uncharacterized protein n=1 Tax=Clostridium moutaii TaxID=3240932 RepID=A0ABV4BTR2_9CLOT